MLKFAFIMRGIPGSGKSTTARKLAESHGPGEFWSDSGIIYYGKPESRDPDTWDLIPAEIGATIHSTDEFFMEDGVYRYIPKLIGKNHRKNFLAFRDSVEAGVPIVICDNTNTTLWEFLKYLKEARSNGYVTSVVTMPHPKIDVAVERNTHDVPRDVIKTMLKRWEAWTGE